jgi:hypothetical protein
MKSFRALTRAWLGVTAAASIVAGIAIGWPGALGAIFISGLIYTPARNVLINRANREMRAALVAGDARRLRAVFDEWGTKLAAPSRAYVAACCDYLDDNPAGALKHLDSLGNDVPYYIVDQANALRLLCRAQLQMPGAVDELIAQCQQRANAGANPEALLSLAGAQLLAGHPYVALPLLEAIAKADLPPASRAACAYWTAEAFVATGRAPEARKLYEEVVALLPQSLYATRARLRLTEKHEGPFR